MLDLCTVALRIDHDLVIQSEMSRKGHRDLVHGTDIRHRAVSCGDDEQEVVLSDGATEQEEGIPIGERKEIIAQSASNMSQSILESEPRLFGCAEEHLR